MTRPVEYDLEIWQGQTWHRPLIWKDSAGDPIDLTGATARMHMRRSVTADEVVIALTTENGRITLGGDTGRIELDLSASDTEAMPARPGVYDLEIELPSGEVRRLMQGKYSVSPEVTRND